MAEIAQVPRPVGFQYVCARVRGDDDERGVTENAAVITADYNTPSQFG